MDPDQLLAELIEHAWKFEEANRRGHFDPALTEARELSEKFRALDNWLKGGGYIPERWAHRPPPADVKQPRR